MQLSSPRFLFRSNLTLVFFLAARSRVKAAVFLGEFSSIIPGAFICAALLGMATAATAQSVTAQNNVVLRGNHPAETSNLTSYAAADQTLTVKLTFTPRNRAALNKLLSDLQNPASPRYHHWLSSTEFDARFGRTQPEVRAVSKWLASHGFQISRASSREDNGDGHRSAGGKRVRHEDHGFQRWDGLRQH